MYGKKNSFYKRGCRGIFAPATQRFPAPDEKKEGGKKRANKEKLTRERSNEPKGKEQQTLGLHHG